MAGAPLGKQEVYDFILKHINSVPELEALLLLWKSKPKPWLDVDVAKRLYIDLEVAKSVLRDLASQGLIATLPAPADGHIYTSTSQKHDAVLRELDDIYRREMVQVSTMIHAKPSVKE